MTLGKMYLGALLVALVFTTVALGAINPESRDWTGRWSKKHFMRNAALLLGENVVSAETHRTLKEIEENLQKRVDGQNELLRDLRENYSLLNRRFVKLRQMYNGLAENMGMEKVRTPQDILVNPTYKKLKEFLAQDKVDENQYRGPFIADEVKLEMAENLGLPIVYTDNPQVFNELGSVIYDAAWEISHGFPCYESLPLKVKENLKPNPNNVVVFENETTILVDYNRGSKLDNAVKLYRYVCVDFARDLQHCANEEGFRAAYAEITAKASNFGYWIVGYVNADVIHAMNAFELSSGKLVFVEPQDDSILGNISIGENAYIAGHNIMVENISLSWKTKNVG